jgi:hypothetical protein
MQLQSIGESIWLAEGGIVNFYGFTYPNRCVVVRLAGGELWVWSPIELSTALMRELSALGQVTHLVSPNKIHHLYLPEWLEAYPDAQLWGPASTIARLWKIDAAHGYAPLEWRLSWFQRGPAREALRTVLSWDPEQVVMAHGAWQDSAGRAYLERVFAWL